MRYQEPEFAPWDGRRVPLTFLAGYLGAGKTTLINSVLATTDRPIAVVVNDVGEINIDAKLIRRASGDTIELSDGCVCCSLVDGFGAAFDQIRARPEPPDHVIVELSGVADPSRVLPWGRSAGFRLDGVVTLVGADMVAGLLDQPDRSLVEAQIRTADLIGLTRTRLCDPSQSDSAIEAVRTLAPDVPLLRADDAELLTTMVRIGGRRPGGAADLGTPTLFDRHVVATVPLPRPITRPELEAIVADLDETVVRAKAIALDPDGVFWSVQVVGRRCAIEPLPSVEIEAPTDLVTIARPPGPDRE